MIGNHWWFYHSIASNTLSTNLCAKKNLRYLANLYQRVVHNKNLTKLFKSCKSSKKKKKNSIRSPKIWLPIWDFFFFNCQLGLLDQALDKKKKKKFFLKQLRSEWCRVTILENVFNCSQLTTSANGLYLSNTSYLEIFSISAMTSNLQDATG